MKQSTNLITNTSGVYVDPELLDHFAKLVLSGLPYGEIELNGEIHQFTMVSQV